MYHGHLGEISNKADWVSPIFEFIDMDTDEAIDLSDATEIYFEIKHPETMEIMVEATLANGKIEQVDDNQFRVNLEPSDLDDIEAGQYLANFSYTLEGKKHDPVLAQIAITEGAGD